jgi:hypothetical protein
MDKKELQYKVDNYEWHLGERSSNGITRNVDTRDVAKFLDTLKGWIAELK